MLRVLYLKNLSLPKLRKNFTSQDIPKSPCLEPCLSLTLEIKAIILFHLNNFDGVHALGLCPSLFPQVNKYGKIWKRFHLSLT
jgi:hypothetical protein